MGMSQEEYEWKMAQQRDAVQERIAEASERIADNLERIANVVEFFRKRYS